MTVPDISTTMLDTACLQAIRELDPGAGDALLSEVLKTYVESSQELVARLLTGLRDNDAQEVCVTAHTLKSSSANVGAVQLAALCRDLEQRARTGGLADGVGDAERVARCFQTTCEALAAAMLSNDGAT